MELNEMGIDDSLDRFLAGAQQHLTAYEREILRTRLGTTEGQEQRSMAPKQQQSGVPRQIDPTRRWDEPATDSGGSFFYKSWRDLLSGRTKTNMLKLLSSFSGVRGLAKAKQPEQAIQEVQAEEILAEEIKEVHAEELQEVHTKAGGDLSGEIDQMKGNVVDARMQTDALIRMALGDAQPFDPSSQTSNEFADIGPKALLERGLIRFRSGLYDAAVRDLTANIGSSAPEIEAFLYRGQAFLLSGKTFSAIDDMDQVIRRDSGHALAYEIRGQAKKLNKDPSGDEDIDLARQLRMRSPSIEETPPGR
jgi:hypothetical protein